MKIYEIVNMYNFHFDRKFYFENKTTFIEFFPRASWSFSRKLLRGWTLSVFFSFLLCMLLKSVNWCNSQVRSQYLCA